MKLILKILAAPVVLVLTLAVAVLSFLHTLAAGVLSVLAFICVVCGLFACTIGGDVPSGMRVLILAFLVSPFGLPAISEWADPEAGRSELLPAELHYGIRLWDNLSRSNNGRWLLWLPPFSMERRIAYGHNLHQAL